MLSQSVTVCHVISGGSSHQSNMAFFRQNTISDNVIPTMHSINNRSSEMHANIGLISILKLFGSSRGLKVGLLYVTNVAPKKRCTWQSRSLADNALSREARVGCCYWTNSKAPWRSDQSARASLQSLAEKIKSVACRKRSWHRKFQLRWAPQSSQSAS